MSVKRERRRLQAPSNEYLLNGAKLLLNLQSSYVRLGPVLAANLQVVSAMFSHLAVTSFYDGFFSRRSYVFVSAGSKH